jgi:hypothetical protein
MSEALYLEIRVIKADYLQAAGDDPATREMFPYCLLECGKEKQRTHVVQDAVAPRFDQQFYFGKGGALSSRDNCRITVVETLKNTTLGVCELNLGDLEGAKRQIKTLNLEGGGRGRLQVEVLVSHNPKGVRMQGTLRKEGGSLGGRTNWKTRWFVLYDDRYDYYESQKAFLSGAKPKGTIMLDAFYCAPTENEEDCEFEVMAYPRRMTLAAASKASMMEWIDKMNNHIQDFNGMLGVDDAIELEDVLHGAGGGA